MIQEERTYFGSHAEAKAHKWFSRRHKTSDAHMEARESFLFKVVSRSLDATERKKYRDSLSPKEQLEVLNKRLGEGVGARRERARLKAQIDGSKAKKKKG